MRQNHYLTTQKICINGVLRLHGKLESLLGLDILESHEEKEEETGTAGAGRIERKTQEQRDIAFMLMPHERPT